MDPQAPNTPAPEIPQVIQPPNHSNNITIISMAIFVLLSLGAVAFLYYQNQQLKTIVANYQMRPSPTPITYYSPSPSPEATSSATPAAKACTMEAKICPDGSSVGRTGPNCEFTPCP